MMWQSVPGQYGQPVPGRSGTPGAGGLPGPSRPGPAGPGRGGLAVPRDGHGDARDGGLPGEERAGGPVTLSPREQETLRWIAAGLTQHQVANRMGVAPTTVDTYLKRIRNKLGPGNKAAILQRAVQRAGLVLDEG